MNPTWANTNYKLLDGDTSLTEGLQVIHVPGHSPGSQAILVETTQAVYCIAQDAIPAYENLEKNIPNGVHLSIPECLESYEKIRQMADHVIPGHEPSFIGKPIWRFP